MLYIYHLPDGGVGAFSKKREGAGYTFIGTANTTKELAEMLKDDAFMEDHAGEISKAFGENG